MKQKELAELTDQELLTKLKAIKPTPLVDAVLIGFLFGIIIFSIWKNAVGLFTLIPLFFIYKLFSKSGEYKAMKKLVKERNLE